jgi:NADH-quinone oxidoreductase subunit M
LQRVIFNPLADAENEKLTDLTPREIALLAPLLAAIVWIGVYPQPLLRRTAPAVSALIQTIQQPAARPPARSAAP